MKRANSMLSMPPVMRQRIPCDKIIRKDPEMQGSRQCKVIFTDISFGYIDRVCYLELYRISQNRGHDFLSVSCISVSLSLPPQFRPIVVREPNGVLRTASWEERDRMIQTYLTNPDRDLLIPPMFSDPHLKEIFDRGE